MSKPTAKQIEALAKLMHATWYKVQEREAFPLLWPQLRECRRIEYRKVANVVIQYFARPSVLVRAIQKGKK